MSVKNDTESFINKLDQRDPLMEPCGTPACICFAELKLLFIYTDCFPFFKWQHIRSNALIENPYTLNFASNNSWFIVSKALEIHK